MFTTSIGRFQFKLPMHFYYNANGYMQREAVAPSRQKDSLRIVTVGESTTQGLHVDQNYPSVLRNLVRSTTKYPGGIEVINAGVPGYISDQWTLLAERELAALRPDIVVLYAGWNDFHHYSPHLEAPKKSWFENPYSYWPEPPHWLRSVTLLNAYLQKLATTPETDEKKERLPASFGPGPIQASKPKPATSGRSTNSIFSTWIAPSPHSAKRT